MLRIPRPRPLRAGPWAALQPAQGAARPVRQGDRAAAHAARQPPRVRPRCAGGRPRSAGLARQRSVRAAGGGRGGRLRVGRRPPSGRAVRGHRHLRGARARPERAASRRRRAGARHLPRGLLPARAGTPPVPRRQHRAAPSRSCHRRRGASRQQGPEELLGLQHAGVLRTGAALRHRRLPAGGDRVQAHGAGTARGGVRGGGGRGVQPHRRGQPPRPDAELPGDRQPELLQARAGPHAALHRLHGRGQHARPRQPLRAAARDGQPALLGTADARRRLPLRPRGHPRARALRRGHAVGVLQGDPAGSRAVARQAHRRAVGRGPRRIPGGQLPVALVRMERQVPRRGAQLLARRRGPGGRARQRASAARPTSTSATAAGRTPRSTS